MAATKAGRHMCSGVTCHGETPPHRYAAYETYSSHPLGVGDLLIFLARRNKSTRWPDPNGAGLANPWE